MHALYGFARVADEIVDDTASALSTDQRAARLDDLAEPLSRGPPSGLPAACRYRAASPGPIPESSSAAAISNASTACSQVLR